MPNASLTPQEMKQMQDAAEHLIVAGKTITRIIQRAQVRRKQAEKK